MTETVIGSWRMNRVPLPGRLAIADRASHRVHHAVHDVQPDPAAGDGRDLLLGREAGEEEEVEQLGLAQPAGHRGLGQPALDDLGAQALEVDAAAVVARGPVWSIPARWRASRRIVPAGGLPAARRSSGDSRPWSSALRIRWLSGASSRSRMSRSTPVASPTTSNRASLPSSRARSRTSRGKPRMPSASGRIRLASTSWCSRLERSSLSWANDSSDSTVSASACKPSAARPRALARSSPGGRDGSRSGRCDEADEAMIAVATVAPRPVPAIDRRSSRTCSDSISRDCRARSRQSASTIGRSRWLCTSASPARPISCVRLSAVTRTTRSRSRSRSLVRARPARPVARAAAREAGDAGIGGSTGGGSATGASAGGVPALGSASTRPSLTAVRSATRSSISAA